MNRSNWHRPMNHGGLGSFPELEIPKLPAGFKARAAAWGVLGILMNLAFLGGAVVLVVLILRYLGVMGG